MRTPPPPALSSSPGMSAPRTAEVDDAEPTRSFVPSVPLMPQVWVTLDAGTPVTGEGPATTTRTSGRGPRSRRKTGTARVALESPSSDVPTTPTMRRNPSGERGAWPRGVGALVADPPAPSARGPATQPSIAVVETGLPALDEDPLIPRATLVSTRDVAPPTAKIGDGEPEDP
jgi:hypothetical protein